MAQGFSFLMATRKRALPVKTAGQQLVEELSADGDPFSLRFLIEQAGQAADFLERLSALLNGDREAWLSVKIGAKTVEVVVNNVLVQHRQQADQLRKLLGEIHRQRGATAPGDPDDDPTQGL
ncbi:Uncharacterised protein [Mycobacteroides abscessus subsp. abscessus]|nr:hypothetical protein [Mycobacteroides abscessus]SID10786.1 Uncharacterised protein [Mycobacteroides abscessus subsp. abscessus]SKU75006.1 Uncharacterised protein [Mycobacteroides abscessus subsp. massiliense]SKU77718.1 Uncharacterised protein [Mycobacteroides abscessus subsp. abscessus]SKV06481.1 Uncharacterised protein [Mycobacteroides abscessus subsp. massiliense]